MDSPTTKNHNGAVCPSPKRYQAWVTTVGKQRADGGRPPHLGGQAATPLANAAGKLWQLGLGWGVGLVGGLGFPVGSTLAPLRLSQALLVAWGGCTQPGCSPPLGLVPGVAEFTLKQFLIVKCSLLSCYCCK